MIELGALLILGVIAVLMFAARRVWPLLLPLPAALAAIAWYEWEFSPEAAPFAAIIVITGYAGLAVGAGLRRLRSRS
jgi:hypothetical protein